MALNRGNPNGSPQNFKVVRAGDDNPNKFKPGQPTVNPNGRAGSKMCTLITMALREKLALMDVKTKQTYASRIADLLLNCVINPDPEIDKTRIMAINEILDRCEGKPKQQIDVNDVTTELRARSDEDLMYHLEHGHFPGETVN